MKLTLWKGYHSIEALRLVAETWEHNSCLVLCPPPLKDFRFLADLPRQFEEVAIAGEWEAPEIPGRRSEVSFPEAPVLGVFTTGTTRSEPRLVFFTKRNIETCLQGILGFFETDRVRSVYCYPQPFHVFGLNLGYVLSLLKGWELVFEPGKYSRESHARRAEIDEGRTLTIGTPTHFEDLVTFVDEKGLDLAPTYSAILGGAKVSRTLWHLVRNRLNVQAPSIGYGSTEASPGVTHLPPGHAPREDGEMGFPLPHLEVTTTESGLRCRGSSISVGWLQSGDWTFPSELTLTDAAYLREDGVYVYQQRTECILNRGGEKFGLEPIEQLLKQEFGQDVVCVAIPDPRLGEDLGLLWKQSEVPPPDRTKIYDFLEKQLGRRFCQTHFMVVEKFPMNENSKIDRKASAAVFASRTAYPIGTDKLAQLIPHRPPMVWVDEVLWADGEEGECRVILKPDAHYYDGGQIRPSSFIEWMAQSYGYILASQYAMEGDISDRSPGRAYLVGFREVEFLDASGPHTELRIRARRTREFGKLTMIDAEVNTPQGQTLARAKLKIYAE